MEQRPQPEVYLLHVWIRDIHPMLWRRFLGRSDCTPGGFARCLADRLCLDRLPPPRFRIHKKDYAVPRRHGLACHDARAIKLADLQFRLNERFLYGLHWEREVIAVARPKQRRAQEYPLVATVGEAILRYLQQVRPRCGRRELFLSLKAPFRPLSTGALYYLVSSRLYQLNIPSQRHGPHALRHACAGHLLAQGFSLKAIGDHLGHRSAYATRTYAKVDLAGLRAVADFDLGGLV